MNSKKLSPFIFVLFGLLSHSAWSYEVETHSEMSREAVIRSNLVIKADLLTQLGLAEYSKNQRFPNSKKEPQTILQLIAFGSVQEDDRASGTQAAYPPLRHFYDPITGLPLFISGYEGQSVPSPDWATEDRATYDHLTVGQEFSFRDGRRYFYEALTEKDKTKREEKFGRTFQTLGHVIHHLQDMAQPQHVRNDVHCDSFACRFKDIYFPSLSM